MTYRYGERANEFLTPDDARQFGLKCIDCGTKDIVYIISVPTNHFPKGAYCLNDLANHCVAARRCPVPIENNLLDALKALVMKKFGRIATTPPLAR